MSKTQEEMIALLGSMCHTANDELNHRRADEILCQALQILGWSDLVDEYQGMQEDWQY